MGRERERGGLGGWERERERERERGRERGRERRALRAEGGGR